MFALVYFLCSEESEHTVDVILLSSKGTVRNYTIPLFKMKLRSLTTQLYITVPVSLLFTFSVGIPHTWLSSAGNLLVIEPWEYWW